jgi:ASC-1-like (ASCH) protein
VTEGLAAAFKSVDIAAGEGQTSIQSVLLTLEAGGEEAKITAEVLKNAGFDKIIDDVANASLNITQLIENTQRVQQGEITWEQYQESIQRVKDRLTSLKEAGALSGDTLIKVESVLEQLEIGLNGDIKSFDQFEKILQESGLSLENFHKGLEKLREEGVLSAEMYDQLTKKVEQYQAANNLKSKEQQGFAEGLNFQRTVTQISNLTSGLMSAAFAVQSLTNVIHILNNEDLTIGQKFEQLFMSIVMAVSMGIPAFTKIKTASSELLATLNS